MYIAHIRSKDKQIQTLAEHTANVAKLCSQSCAKIGLLHLGHLVGLLHDMGKANRRFADYLESRVLEKPCPYGKGSIHHAPVGAIYAYDTWYHPEESYANRWTAQIIAMVVLAHHSGLYDVFDPEKKSPFLNTMERDKEELCYTESVQNFLAEVCNANSLKEEYDQAVQEVEEIYSTIKNLPKKQTESGTETSANTDTDNEEKSILRSLVTRMVLSALIDADRWDSACFDYGMDPFIAFEPPMPKWQQAYTSLENHLSSFSHTSEVDTIRQEISDTCAKAAQTEDKLYRLTVPTGGGKTLSSLRFAIAKAMQDPEIERILYPIPFNTILDQNSQDTHDALGDTLPILEHHGNVSYEDKTDDEIEEHKKLTERWDTKGIIFTSVVQFMNALYRAENTHARRMHHLAHSLLIFDEIQALPKKCTRLFEIAIDFLIHICGCTVILCTATQPCLTFRTVPRDILPDYESYYTRLKRTQWIDETKNKRSNDEAIEKIITMLEKYRAVLMIVNTKKEAAQLYEGVKQAGIPAIHLSTNMYPQHRLQCIQKIKERDPNAKLFCVSTALIEAGINISFPCVIRSLTGLGSIMQAAGRCNRNAELPAGTLGDVYIWDLKDEKLTHLDEIERCADVASGILHKNPEPDSLWSIKKYYENEREEFEKDLSYPVNNIKNNIVSMLGINSKWRPENNTRKLPLCGAYRTAGENFHVIDAVTYSVLVPHKEGEELYHLLSSDLSMEERIRCMQRASRYSISLYKELFQRLLHDEIIFPIRDGEMYVLQKENYNEETGLTVQSEYMDLLQY